MPAARSSRRRYAEYLSARRQAGSKPLPDQDTEGDAKARRKRARGIFALVGRLWEMLAGNRWLVLAAMATLTIQSSSALLLPACTKVAVDYIITDQPGPTGLPRFLPEWARDAANREAILWTLCGSMVVLVAVRLMLAIWARWQMTRLTKRLQVSLRRRVFDHAVRLPLHRVHQIKSGGVASILREDAGGSADLLFHLVYNPWNAIIQLVGTLVILAAVDWRMLAGALVFIPVIGLMHRVWLARIRPLYRDIKQTRTSVDAHATEAFGGIRVVRGFDRSRGEASRFSRGTHLMARQEVLTWWWSRGVDMAWAFMIPLATTAVLLYGGLAVMHGRLTIGDMMMFSAYLLMLLGPLEVLAASASEMQTNLAAFDRVLDLLDEPTEFADTPGDTTLDPARVRGEIEFQGVSFAYPRAAKRDGTSPADPAPPEPVLRDVTLAVRPGQVVALVGRSGAGKTTLCNLVARFYDPTQGVVLLDGIDLRRIRVGSYRRVLGIVEQDVFLFDGTVAENIAYARRDATPDQIRAAAAVAYADEFIDGLEHGYETLIGERGVRLSGGQKQRLAIARAVLADPRILILDEATSNLDTESERHIQRALARLMKGRTCFVIAHRLSTIRHADLIVVLEQGRIIETGTHDELLAKGGRYAEFLRMQIEDLDTPDDDPEADAARRAIQRPLA